MTATAPPMTPRRVLLLLDGDHALPERGDFFRGAQGGSLAAHSLHHRLKVWASSETGGACQTSVHVFGKARKLGDFADVLPVVKDLTDPPSDVEEGEAVGAETMAAGPPPGLAIPVAERAARPPFHNVASAEEGLTPPAATLASLRLRPPKPCKVALPRAPPVPSQYEPLLRILIAHQGPSPAGIVPPALLWSAVGNELQKSELKGRYGKLARTCSRLKKNGWVLTGKGETEGSKWVMISQRGLRAMGKKLGDPPDSSASRNITRSPDSSTRWCETAY
ncbi:hypothetical protein JCM10295v2_003340 [Rhodotorula toruloides]